MKNAVARLNHRVIRVVRRANREEEKVFCIGRNKTGTTTMARALAELGYRVAPQRYGELLSDDCYLYGRFGPIVSYCAYYNAFQDIPFSWPETYRVMDEAFPNARFVLTVRDTPEQWYDSLVRFQSKRFGANDRLPTADDLRASEYVRPGFVFRSKSVWGGNLYDRDALIRSYIDYLDEVEQYFEERSDKLLKINVGKSEDYIRLCRFLRLDPVRSNGFPWENQT